MKKLKILFLLLITHYANAQSVTVNSILVNSQFISGTTINLGSNTNAFVLFDANITLPSIPNDNYPGTISVCYKKSSSSPEITANGGSGGSLLFLGSTTATRAFSIELLASQFDPTGGNLYVKYVTYSGVTYKSSNIPVIKNTTSNGGGVPYNPSPVNAYFENVPYDGIPVLWNVDDPGTGEEIVWTNTYDQYEDFKVYNRSGGKTTLQNSANLRQRFKGVNSYGNIYYTSFSPSHVVTYSVRRPFPTVKRLYFNNVIEKDQYVTMGNTASTIVGNDASYSAEGTVIYLNNYQWQKRVVKKTPYYSQYVAHMNLYGWKDIPNANSKDYTPSDNFTEVTEYRRLIFDIGNGNPYNKSAATSNVVTIYPISTNSIDNVICCDQNIYTGSTINPLIGTSTTIPFPIYNRKFQWQAGSLRNGSIVWSDLPNTNQKDYTPIRPTGRFQNGLVRYYRRNVIQTNPENIDYNYHIGNTVTFTFYNTSSRIINPDNLKEINIKENNLKIYPNPTTSIINLDTDREFIGKVTIFDISGKTIHYEDFSNYKNSSIDLSVFESGLYLLKIEHDNKVETYKISKK